MTYTQNFVQAGAYTIGRQGNTIDVIIVHWWGTPSPSQTFDTVVSYFQHGGNKTSAHYVVEAGRVTQMVRDSDTAYAAGNWAVNLRSINIECNPRATDADKETIVELIKNLRAVHGDVPIIGHRDVVSTDCPGAYYPPNEVLAPWLNQTPPVTKPPVTISKDKIMYRVACADPLANGVYMFSLDTGAMYQVPGDPPNDDFDSTIVGTVGVINLGTVSLRALAIYKWMAARARESVTQNKLLMVTDA